jgi:hypothetical protein
MQFRKKTISVGRASFGVALKSAAYSTENASRKNSASLGPASTPIKLATRRVLASVSGYDQAAPGSSTDTFAIFLAANISSSGMSNWTFIRSVCRSYPTRRCITRVIMAPPVFLALLRQILGQSGHSRRKRLPWPISRWRGRWTPLASSATTCPMTRAGRPWRSRIARIWAASRSPASTQNPIPIL